MDNKKTAKYIYYYNTPDNAENRVIFPSGCQKVESIASGISSNQRRTLIISASNTKSVEANSPRTEKCIDENTTLILPKGYKRGGFIQNKISGLLFKLAFARECNRNIKKNDTVIVYHTMNYIEFIKRLKRRKNLKLVLQVEEIHADVNGTDKSRAKEFSLFKEADAYIFPTVMLNDKINDKKKPYAIIHGTYQLPSVFESKRSKKTECVYAGTLDMVKGGAIQAVRCAEFLDENYTVRVIGNGSEEEKRILMNEIERISAKTACEIVYDGEKRGDEFLKYIQACDVGLNTQFTDKEYNNTSFPSKILTFFANGLRVVAGRCENFERSKVGDMLYYYEGNDPKNIAEAIKNIDFNKDYDGRKRIEELRKAFAEEIEQLISVFD